MQLPISDQQQPSSSLDRFSNLMDENLNPSLM